MYVLYCSRFTEETNFQNFVQKRWFSQLKEVESMRRGESGYKQKLLLKFIPYGKLNLTEFLNGPFPDI